MTTAPTVAATAMPATLAGHAQRAWDRLDERSRAYLFGAAADERTLRANVEAWAQWPLLPRVLRPSGAGHTRTRVLGRELAHPMMLAPTAFQQLAHPDGERASACAASAQGAGMVLSAQSTCSVEQVAACIVGVPGAGPLWMQVHWDGDRARVLELALRARAAGCEALVMTIDAPVHGARDREREAGFRLPPGLRAAHALAHDPAAAVRGSGRTGLCDGLLQQAPGWDDVAWLRAAAGLPLLLKGILHPADARTALEVGIDGLIVSNHGGRTLDTALPTALALPAVAEAVAGAVPLLVDGGIRRGTDVFKALALGATAVLIGRAALFGLASAGAHGVAHVLRLLRDELEIAMALSGCPTIDAIGRAALADHPLPLLSAPAASPTLAGQFPLRPQGRIPCPP